MFRLNLGSTQKYCDGLSRRNFLALGVAGMASLGLPELLRAKELTAGTGQPTKDTSVILIWLDGGPSHMDMYDMKPDAPAEYRGIWKPIRTRVPGFDITELFPKQAKVTDKFSMVRSLHHDTGDHFAGGHRMLTTKDMGVSGANNRGKFPGIGAIVAREFGPRQPGMPGYVARAPRRQHRPQPRLFRRPLARRSAQSLRTPAAIRMPPNFKVQNLNLAAGLDARQAGRPPLAGAAFRHDPRGTRQPGRQRRRWTASPRRRSSSSAARRRGGRSTSARKTRGCATATAGTNWGQSTPAGPPAGRGRLDLRHRPLRRLGSSLGSEGGLWNAICRWSIARFAALFTRPGRSRLAGHDAGGAVRRVQPDAEDERRRQRRRADEHGHAGPRPLGQLDVLPDGRRRRQGRPGRRLDRSARHSGRTRGR